MNMVLDFKSVLLFQLFYQIRHASCNYDESFNQQLDSQSRDDSDTEEREDYNLYKILNRNQNYDYEKENNFFNSNYNDECNSCACNKCDYPPDCCKEVCRSCPKPLSPMSQIQMMLMSQMPQLSMHIPPVLSMSIPQNLPTSLGQNFKMQTPQSQLQQMQILPMQIPHMQLPEMQIPQMQSVDTQIPKMPLMQISRMPTPERPLSFSDQSLIYFPFSSNIMSFLKNYSISEIQASKVQQFNNISTTLAFTKAVTTVASITITNKTSVITPFPIRDATKEQTEYQTPRSKQIQNKTMLEAAIRNALKAFSYSMKKTTDKSRRRYNQYVLASALRKTKPVISNTDPSRFGILPIPSNMAESLLLETRNAKGIRP